MKKPGSKKVSPPDLSKITPQKLADWLNGLEPTTGSFELVKQALLNCLENWIIEEDAAEGIKRELRVCGPIYRMMYPPRKPRK